MSKDIIQKFKAKTQVLMRIKIHIFEGQTCRFSSDSDAVTK